MSFEVVGKLHKKFDTESKTATFQAREFVIEVDGTYPQFVKFQLVQDRCALIDNYNEGDSIRVHFDLRGREWQGKYFTNLNAWRIEAGAAAAPQGPPPSQDGDFPTMENAPAAGNNTASAADDDLPF
ncbi:MAG: DUF3127 domain-containing protein [Bacteroidota bacterium]